MESIRWGGQDGENSRLRDFINRAGNLNYFLYHRPIGSFFIDQTIFTM